MTTRDRVVEAAIAWVRALESEYRARLILELPTVVIDERLAAYAEHKQAFAAATTAEVQLMAAARAAEREAR